MHYLQKKLDLNSTVFLSEAKVYVVGSTAENLAISVKDDRDLLLVLGSPYTPQYFQVSQTNLLIYSKPVTSIRETHSVVG